MQYTYETIIPIIVDVVDEGNKVNCTFGIPGTDHTVNSSASVTRDNSGAGKVQKSVSRVVSRQGRMAAGRMVRSLLGGGILGRVGARSVRAGWRGMDPSNLPSDSDKKNAVLEAFLKVSDQFQYNSATGQFSAAAPKSATGSSSGSKNTAAPAKPLSPFEKQMEKGPVSNPFEQELLARMLVEMANVDGNISSEERSFIEDIMGEDTPNLQAIMHKDPISPIECESVDEAVRETLYMLAWCMACADYYLNPAQIEILEQFADMFGFPPPVEQNLQIWAKLQMLEMAIDINCSRQELHRTADQLELDHFEAEKHLIFMKKNQ